MTTIEMEVALMKFFKFTQKLIVPNVTDMSGLVKFETDLLILTKSLYATGVEIKISKSDFKAEFKKRQYNKRNFLGETYYGKFKNFYFAFPKALAEECIDEVPEEFGILTVERPYKVRVLRKPKLLYNIKWSEKDKLDLLRIGCMRIYNLKSNLINCKNEK